MAGELIFLVIDDDAVQDRLSAALHAAGYKVLAAHDEAGALEHLGQMRFVLPDALVMPLLEPSPLLQKLRQNPITADVPVVVLSDHPAEDRRRALRQGLSELVAAPYDQEELLLTLSLALQRAAGLRRDSRTLRGSLALLSVADLLQTLEAGRRSGVAMLRGPGRTGSLWVGLGQPLDAELDDGRRGEEAFHALLALREGSFEVVFGDVAVPRRIETSLTGLLLEAARRQDELARGAAPPHAALPDPPPAPPRDVLAAHRALTLLNVAGAYASDLVQPALLSSALEESRQALLAEWPELAAFQVGPAGQVSLHGAGAAVPPERLAGAAARWTLRLFARLERALPGRFGRERLPALTEAVRDDMRSLGFDEALGLERAPVEAER